MTDLYAVMGNPIHHSKSPLIHSIFAEQSMQDLVYSAMLVPVDGFDSAVSEFFKGSGKGLNITVPFKEQAFKIADTLTERAKTAQAVNTLKLLGDGTILGDNTDGAGLVRDLIKNNQVQLSGKRILMVGAGGAVRGVLQPMLKESPAEIVICNRTYEKAEKLAEGFHSFGKIRPCEFSDLEGSFDIIINGTSASLNGDVPPLPISVVSAHTQVYDMMYAAEPTAFMVWAQKLGGAKQMDGLGMLVEQAAVSFHLWREILPDSHAVLSKLKAELESTHKKTS